MPFPILDSGKNGSSYDLPAYFINLSIAREAALKARIPLMNIVQASTFLKDFRKPTPAEMRWQVYTTLAYGGRGISYFLYWGPGSYGGLYQDGKPTDLVPVIAQLNKEIATIGPELMQLRSEGLLAGRYSELTIKAHLEKPFNPEMVAFFAID